MRAPLSRSDRVIVLLGVVLCLPVAASHGTCSIQGRARACLRDQCDDTFLRGGFSACSWCSADYTDPESACEQCSRACAARPCWRESCVSAGVLITTDECISDVYMDHPSASGVLTFDLVMRRPAESALRLVYMHVRVHPLSAATFVPRCAPPAGLGDGARSMHGC